MATGVAAPTAQTPTNKSFGTLKREVADFVRSPDDPEALEIAGIGINNAIRKLNNRIWWWTVAYQDIALVQGRMDYSLSSDFKRSMIIERIKSDGHTDGKIRYYNPEEFEEIFRTSGSSGQPAGATIFNAQVSPKLSLDVGPSSSFVEKYPTLRHRYYKKLSILSGDQQVVDVPSEVELFLTWYGREEACAVYRPQLFSLARSEREEVWRELVADNSEHHLSNWSL